MKDGIKKLFISDSGGTENSCDKEEMMIDDVFVSRSVPVTETQSVTESQRV